MDTELLRAVVAVSEHGGFSAAARALNRTQSAVSLQIKRLEERLGAPVFQRTSRSVALTRAGGTFLPYARQLLHLHGEAVEAAALAERNTALRIGMPDELAAAYLPTVLPAFAQRFPQVPVEVTCDLSTALIGRLADGLLDLVLAVRHGPSATGEVVAQQPLVWVGAESLSLQPGRPVPLAMNPEGCVYRAQAFAELSRLNRSWRVVYTSQSPTGINIAVRLGMAVTIKASRSVPEGCRVLGEADGLPPLAPALIELHRSPAVFSRAAEAIADELLDAVTGEVAVRSLVEADELAGSAEVSENGAAIV